MFAILLIVVNVIRVTAGAATPSATPLPTCYENSRDYYPYLSTRTAYELVHGRLTRLENTCTPIQIWMLARHGTRYPNKEVIEQMQTLTEFRDEILRNHERGDGSLCNIDLQKLRDWRQNPNLRMKNAEVLSEQGEKDLRQLAERLKGVFSELLDERTAKPGDFIFRSTNTQRTKASMEAFANGLFGNDRRFVQIEPPPVNDTLLAPRDVCPAWAAGYEIDRVNAERDKFTEGPEVRTVLEDVGMRLGFNKPLDYDKIRTLYDACRFETAWHPHLQSPWCLVFRGDELKVLEYREDLDYYYFAGPARPMSAKLGCQTLSDMFEHFKSLTTGDLNKQPKGIFYFAHTVTLQHLMSALKIAVEPTPLLASNYAEMQTRDYRTSLLGPFATNVVAVFYRCDGSTTPYKVTMYTAEKSAKLTGCSGEACDWEFLEQKFAPDVEKCSMDFCFEKVSDSAMASSYSIVLMLVTLSVQRFVLT